MSRVMSTVISANVLLLQSIVALFSPVGKVDSAEPRSQRNCQVQWPCRW